jgi:hypothetical protein
MSTSRYLVNKLILMLLVFVSLQSHTIINTAQATLSTLPVAHSPANNINMSSNQSAPVNSTVVSGHTIGIEKLPTSSPTLQKKQVSNPSALQILAVPQVSQVVSDTIGDRTIVAVTCDQPFALMGGELFLSVNGAEDDLSPAGVWTPFSVSLGSPLPTLEIKPGTVTVDLGGHRLGGPVAAVPFGSNNATIGIIYLRSSSGGSPNGDSILFAPVVMAPANSNCRAASCTGPLSSC